MSPNITIIGGGPVGLALATTIRHYLPAAKITVHDARWQKDPHTNKVEWRGPEQGVNRREQVVTLQSAVWARLPKHIQQTLFPPSGFTSVWPIGPESPRHIGFPRNVRILDIEDRLLALAKKSNIILVPGRVRPQEINLQGVDLLCIADGPRSYTRSFFEDKFGRADPAPYSVGDEHVEDVILGLRVQSNLSDADSVILTVAQNRFLMNANHGDGYIYMRLTKDEVDEVRGRTRNGKRFVGCVQSAPCMMRAEGGQFKCPTHGTTFVPAQDAYSLLWPRVQEGLKLFDAQLQAVTVFRLSMVRRAAFTAELTDTGVAKPVFGALVGDAANAIHFWPGRGLNHGLSSAVALARCLKDRWGKSSMLRSADFTRYEAAMSALQHRHKDRAWRAMVQMRDGKITPVHSIIATAIENSDECDRISLLEGFMKRVASLAERLESRIPGRANISIIREKLDTFAGVETLNVLAEAEGWETRLSGGPEVDLDALIPDPDAVVVRKEPVPNTPPSESVISTDVDCDDTSEWDVLSDESIRASFKLALRFVRCHTLSWNEARRELRALLVRADLGADLTNDDLLDAIETVDGEDPDRIDYEEFLSAMKALIDKAQSGVGKLAEIWHEKFANACGASGQIEPRQAARIVCSLAASLGAMRGDLVQNRDKVRKMFEDKGHALVDQESFLETAALIMFGK